MKSPLLKGNYSLDRQPSADQGAAPTLEDDFERSALQKLGGSIAFVKKSASFVWKGPERDPKPR